MKIMTSFGNLKACLLICVALVLGACASTPSDSIAPQGKLRMGLYRGTPTSILAADDPQQTRGIGYELGKHLAAQLGLPYDPIVYEKNADVLAAAKSNAVDLVFTNASADRAKYLQFSKTVIKIEKGFLISPHSKITSQSQINRKGVKIGYSVGSNSQSELPALIPNAALVATGSTKQAIAQLKSGELDGFSTNKAILYEMASVIPNSRVLPAVIGYEYLALGTPKDHHVPEQLLNDFVDQMSASGKLSAIIVRSGIQGLAPN
jgi:polar amino acid transport system substrate-binding protein